MTKVDYKDLKDFASMSPEVQLQMNMMFKLCVRAQKDFVGWAMKNKIPEDVQASILQTNIAAQFAAFHNEDVPLQVSLLNLSDEIRRIKNMMAQNPQRETYETI